MRPNNLTQNNEENTMKDIKEMSYIEIKWIASLFDDDAQAQHHAAYLEELVKEYTTRVIAQMFQWYANTVNALAHFVYLLPQSTGIAVGLIT